MTKKLEVLLAIHDAFLNRNLSLFLGRSHVVTAVITLGEMQRALGMVQGADPATSCRYAAVIMDVNLGYPAASNIEPGRMIYQYLLPLIAERQVKFTAVSGDDRVVETAVREGIPCVTKPDGILNYIRELQQ